MPTYIEDLTGLSSANRVQNELHPVSAVVSSSHKSIVPDYAPFFADGFIMHHVSTGGVVTPMVLGVDYVLSMEFNSASNSLGLMVHGGVTLLDNRVDGNYRLTSYQTIGGNWLANPVDVLILLTSFAYNPRMIFYEQIANLPSAFPPDLHTNNTADLSRIGNLITALNNIASELADGTNLLNHTTSLAPHMEARLTDEQRNNLKIAIQNNLYTTFANDIKSKLVDADDIVNIASYIVTIFGSAVSGDISEHNTSLGSHLDIRNLINGLSDALTAHNTSGSSHTALFTSKANINSPAFTGTPTAPTVLVTDDSTKIATTAFVKSAILTIADVSSKANINSPAFTGSPTAPTVASTDNSTKIATTAFVKSVLNLTGDFSTKANINSPVFTGNPTAPTPDVSDDSLSIATTAFIKQLFKMTGYVAPSGTTQAEPILATDSIRDALNKLDTAVKYEAYIDQILSITNSITMTPAGSTTRGVFKPFKHNTFWIQWGRFTLTSVDSSIHVTFPSTFATRCVSVITNGIGDARNYSGVNQTEAYVDTFSSVGFMAYGDSGTREHTYIAIGY